MKHFCGSGQAWKVVRIRVFTPANGRSRLISVHAGRGKAYSDTQVDDILDGIANDIEKQFPGQEYELVSLGPAHFNFVWRGERKAPWRQEPASA